MIEVKMRKLIQSSKSIVEKLKRKHNSTTKKDEYEKITKCINENQQNIALLSHSAKEIDALKKLYTEEQIVGFFEGIKLAINKGKALLK